AESGTLRRRELQEGAARDFAVGEGVGGADGAFEALVAAGDHLVEGEQAFAVPAEVGLEVVLGGGGAAVGTDEASLRPREDEGVEGDGAGGDADDDGGASAAVAEDAGADSGEALVDDGLQADGVEGVVDAGDRVVRAAAGEVSDGLDGIGLGGVDGVRSTEAPG